MPVSAGLRGGTLGLSSGALTRSKAYSDPEGNFSVTEVSDTHNLQSLPSVFLMEDLLLDR
jgi:hypothetical protein